MVKSLREAGELFRQAGKYMRDVVIACAPLIPQTRMARETGLARNTVRSWIGKPTRGDTVRALAYDSDTEVVTGTYVPRTDHPDAMPPVDAAWVDDGSAQGPMMVKASTVVVLTAEDLAEDLADDDSADNTAAHDA